MELQGKVVIVTGAGGGIGGQTSLLAAKAGASLVLVDRDVASIEAIALECEKLGAKAIAVQSDVTKSADVQAYVKAAVDTFGTIDGFFNNAGIEGSIKPLVDCTEEEFDKVIAVNLKGVFLGLKYVLPVMIANGRGSIVNTGSLASVRGLPMTSPYNAAKHGVLGLTRAATSEVARTGVRINAVLPGMVETRLLKSIVGTIFDGDVDKGIEFSGQSTPIGRNATPAEIGEVVVFLLSDRARYVSGAAWAVDGGVLATIGNGG